MLLPADLRRRAQLVRSLSSDITGTKVPGLVTAIQSFEAEVSQSFPTWGLTEAMAVALGAPDNDCAAPGTA